MQLVELKNHPNYIAVVDGRGKLGVALNAARHRLHDPRVNAAVIINDTAGLANNAASLRSTFNLSAASVQAKHFLVFKVGQSSFWARLDNEHVAINVYDAESDVTANFGQNVSAVMQGLSHAFPEMICWSLSSKPIVQAEPTVQTSVFTDEVEIIRKALCGQSMPYRIHIPRRAAAGTVATMAIEGPGTVIYNAHPENFHRKLRAWPFNGHSSWHCHEPINVMDAWQVATGDICLLRDNRWPGECRPSVFSSPPEGSAERLMLISAGGPKPPVTLFRTVAQAFSPLPI